MDKNYHEGHRDRMRAKFAEHGGDVFEPHEMLEMLLYYSIPRRDTNEIAHSLLEHFHGSISEVMDASVSELMEVRYISYNTAVLIKMIPTFCRMYEQDIAKPKESVTSASAAKAYFKKKFFGRENEMFYMLFLDNSGKVISCELVAQGSVNTANIDINKIVRLAISTHASSAVAAHNHPRGTPLPSADDLNGTKKLYAALANINVSLNDHIIVGADNMPASMAETDRYGYIFSPKLL